VHTHYPGEKPKGKRESKEEDHDGGGGGAPGSARIRRRDGQESGGGGGDTTTTNTKATSHEGFQDLVIVTHNIKDFSLNNKFIDERLKNLTRCYEDESIDVLVIQEVQTSNQPTNRLASALGVSYVAINSNSIGDNEVAAFIYDSTKLEFLGCEVGVPISPTSSLAKNGIATPLPLGFVSRCGFTEAELTQHTYPGVLTHQNKLFVHTPAYALFQHRHTGAHLVICCVHLRSDPSTELAYTGDLLPRDPETAWRERGILFVLCGDMNLTKANTSARMEAPIHDKNEEKYYFALPPPFSEHVTNLGRAFLAETGKYKVLMRYDEVVVSRKLGMDRPPANLFILEPGEV